MIHPFLKILYDEHAVIVNAVDVVKQSKALIGKDDVLYEEIIRQLIGFFRGYADQYHHYKEENILFPEMNKRNELLQDGVIKEMFDNHEDFRGMIQRIEGNLNAGKFPETQSELEKYGEALLDHIAVENDEVFQMAETLFDENELEKIGFRFTDCDRELGTGKKEEFQALVDSMRNRIFAHQ